MSQRRHYKQLFIRDTRNALNQTVSVFGTIVDIDGPTAYHDTGNTESTHRPLVCCLDDGTGQIQAVYFVPRHHHLQPLQIQSLQIGADVVVGGTVQEYRHATQIKCDWVRCVEDVNYQSVWINQVIFYSHGRSST